MSTHNIKFHDKIRTICSSSLFELLRFDCIFIEE